MRRAAAVVGALVAFAAGVSVAVPRQAHASDSVCPRDPEAPACVVITWHGDQIDTDSTYVTGAVIQGDDSQLMTDYPYCSIPGCPGITPYIPEPAGTPLRNLITPSHGMDFVPDSVQSLTITAPGTGRTDTLDAADLRANTDDRGYPFQMNDQGTLPYPYLYANGNNGDQIFYLRPQRDPGDPNENYQVPALLGEMDIDITVTGTVLHPTIRASKSSVTVGGSVVFTTSVGDMHGTPSYEWTFGDGDTDTTIVPKVTHGYGRPGDYPATVTVTDTGGGAGQSQPVTIKVGTQPTPPTRSSVPGHGTATHSNPIVGPLSGGGVHVGAAETSSPEGPTASSRPASATAARASVGNATSPQSSSPAAQDGRGFVAIDGILLDPRAGTIVARAQQRVGHAGAAPAARAGSVAGAGVFGVSIGAGALLLLVLGAFDESRRPGRGPRRGTRS